MSQAPGKESKPVIAPPVPVEDEDEPDDWDKRIIDTGCSAENEKLRFCFVDRKDWRLCKTEVCFSPAPPRQYLPVSSAPPCSLFQRRLFTRVCNLRLLLMNWGDRWRHFASA
ncbi:hypothetical protein BDD12DRAFT_912547, partial [Trichophaea hybrida]